MERFIKFSKEKYTLIGGALIALILFMGDVYKRQRENALERVLI